MANDPTGLNANWTAGTGAYYAALGGDPERTILLADQEAAPDCAGADPLLGAAATPDRRPPPAPRS